MKKNRRSQLNKADKFKENAEYLLKNFSWEKEERIILEIMTLKSISISDLREANWTEVSLGIKTVMIRHIEMELSEETFNDFKESLSELKDFTGEIIDPRNTLHKIFTHNTAKEINKTLLKSEN